MLWKSIESPNSQRMKSVPSPSESVDALSYGTEKTLSENGPSGANASKTDPGDSTRDSLKLLSLLRALTEASATATGQAFFLSLVQHPATALGTRFCFVAECLPHKRARSLAWWIDGKQGENFEYELPGTPCLHVAEGRTCHYPDRIPELFPEDKGMIDLGTVSYLGVPLRDSRQRVIGHLVVFDDKPMPPDL